MDSGHDVYYLSEEQLSEMIGFQIFAKPELTRQIRSQKLPTVGSCHCSNCKISFHCSSVHSTYKPPCADFPVPPTGYVACLRACGQGGHGGDGGGKHD